MYFRTIKILAILLKWHRLLALHSIKSFSVSIPSAAQCDPDSNWNTVLFCYSRICRDYKQKLQIWQNSEWRWGFKPAVTWLSKAEEKSHQECPGKTVEAIGMLGCQWRKQQERKRNCPGCLSLDSYYSENDIRCRKPLGQTRWGDRSHREHREENPEVVIYFMKAS